MRSEVTTETAEVNPREHAPPHLKVSRNVAGLVYVASS
jgi:hypothetical protein